MSAPIEDAGAPFAVVDDDGRPLVDLAPPTDEHQQQVARVLARILVARALRRLEGTPAND